MYTYILAEVLLLHTKSSILGIYCYATFWAFLPVFGVGAYGPEPYGTSCTLAWHGHEIFVTFFLIACVLLPVIVMNVSYGRILWHIKMNRRRTKRSVSNMGMSVKKKDTYLIKVTIDNNNNILKYKIYRYLFVCRNHFVNYNIPS